MFGRFETKKAAAYRRLGSKLIGMMNRRIFGQPNDLVVSNFRILRRDVDRPDLCLPDGLPLHHRSGAAVLQQPVQRHGPPRAPHGRVELLQHDPDPAAGLHDPVQLLVVPAALRGRDRVRLLVAELCCSGAAYFIRGLFADTAIPGWTTLIVLLAVFNGFTIAMLSMLGEYVVRTLNAVSAQETYHVVERVSR